MFRSSRILMLLVVLAWVFLMGAVLQAQEEAPPPGLPGGYPQAPGAAQPAASAEFHRAYITGTVTYQGKGMGSVTVRATSSSGHAEATTASNGNYALGVGEGSWKVTASKEGFRATPPQDASVQSLGTRDHVDFVLEPARATIVGTTRTIAGKPLARVLVTAGGGMAYSGKDGSYRLSVEEGTHQVRGMKQDFTQTKVPRVTVAAGQTARADLEFSYNNSFLKGEVMSEDGVHLPGSMVMAMKTAKRAPGTGGEEEAGPPMPSEEEGGGGYAYTRAGKEGRFSLRVSAGTHMLMASHPGYTMSMRQMMQGGVVVPVADGETRDGLVILLAPARGTPTPSPEQPAGQRPAGPLELVGVASLTPNAVLHWHRTGGNLEERTREFRVYRSGAPITAAGLSKAQILASPVGEPGQEYFSFTDETGRPGVPYYYAVTEVGTRGPGPLSNVVKVTIR